MAKVHPSALFQTHLNVEAQEGRAGSIPATGISSSCARGLVFGFESNGCNAGLFPNINTCGISSHAACAGGTWIYPSHHSEYMSFVCVLLTGFFHYQIHNKQRIRYEAEYLYRIVILSGHIRNRTRNLLFCSQPL